MTGIEKNPVMAELAARNVRGNHKEDKIRIVEAITAGRRAVSLGRLHLDRGESPTVRWGAER